MTVTRPIMRYHGGKWRLAPWVISHFPPHRIYVEPFGGAASVLMQKARTYAEVINDLDGEIVNVYRVLRDQAQAEDLERLLRLTPFAREEFEAAYQTAGDPVEQARRTIAKAFMSFGSNGIHRVKNRGMRTTVSTHAMPATGFRANSNRSGTTPAHDWMHYPDCLYTFTERLQGVVIESRPAINIIRTHDHPDALIYCDPPYVMTSRSDEGQDYRHEMTDDDHCALAEQLHACRGMVIISGYPSPLYDDLYSEWHQVTTIAHIDHAQKRQEVLWMNRAACRSTQQMKLFGEQS